MRRSWDEGKAWQNRMLGQANVCACGEDEMKELLVSVKTPKSNLLLLLDLLQLFILKEQSKRCVMIRNFARVL